MRPLAGAIQASPHPPRLATQMASFVRSPTRTTLPTTLRWDAVQELLDLCRTQRDHAIVAVSAYGEGSRQGRSGRGGGSLAHVRTLDRERLPSDTSACTAFSSSADRTTCTAILTRFQSSLRWEARARARRVLLLRRHHKRCSRGQARGFFKQFSESEGGWLNPPLGNYLIWLRGPDLNCGSDQSSSSSC